MGAIGLVAASCPELTPAELALIEVGIRQSAAEYIEFGRGDLLDTSNVRDANLWIVVSGNFVVYAKDIFISELGPGSLVGEQAVVERNAGAGITISADRASAALRMHRKNWERLMTDPDQCRAWSRLLVLNLSQKLAKTTSQYIEHVNAELEKERLLKMFVSDFSLGHVKAFLHGDVDSYKTVNALVMFSDLVGFSSQVAKLEPNEAGNVTRSLLQIQAEHLRTSGAQLDKFMGDGIMGYWISDDDALSQEIAAEAVMTSLEIVPELKKKSAEFGLDIGIRIGMHFGQAIAGNFGCDGRVAHTLIGPDVNLAARYEQARSRADEPPLGPVRISPSVFGALPSKLQDAFSGPVTAEVKHGMQITMHHTPL